MVAEQPCRNGGGWESRAVVACRVGGVKSKSNLKRRTSINLPPPPPHLPLPSPFFNRFFFSCNVPRHLESCCRSCKSLLLTIYIHICSAIAEPGTQSYIPVVFTASRSNKKHAPHQDNNNTTLFIIVCRALLTTTTTTSSSSAQAS